jgi:hypothetical protein
LDDGPESKAGATALIVISALIALACASAIGTVATLVVFAVDNPPLHETRSGECAVVAWKTGTTYCFGDRTAEANGALAGPTVVIQAQAGPAR